MKTKTLLSRFIVTPFVLAFVFAASIALGLTSADSLRGLGMGAELAHYITKYLIRTDSSSNLILPVQTSKKLSVTVNGVEVESINSTGDTITGTLTVSGATTFTGASTIPAGLIVPTASEEAVAGAGTTVADASALSATKHLHQITGANGTVGWKFPSLTVGQVEILLNTTAGVPKIYAVSGGTCNGGATDAACTLVTGIVSHICWAAAANTLICS